MDGVASITSVIVNAATVVVGAAVVGAAVVVGAVVGGHRGDRDFGWSRNERYDPLPSVRQVSTEPFDSSPRFAKLAAFQGGGVGRLGVVFGEKRRWPRSSGGRLGRSVGGLGGLHGGRGDVDRFRFRVRSRTGHADGHEGGDDASTDNVAFGRCSCVSTIPAGWAVTANWIRLVIGVVPCG